MITKTDITSLICSRRNVKQQLLASQKEDLDRLQCAYIPEDEFAYIMKERFN